MNGEAYDIRLKINTLKERLLEIEGEELSAEEKASLCSSSTCGHDVVLENLQRLTRDYGLKSLAVMACWDKDPESNSNRWYSTNLSPHVLSHCLRDVRHILEFLHPLYDIYALKIIQHLFEVDREDSLKPMVEKTGLTEEEVKTMIVQLKKNQFIERYDGFWTLSNKGWQSFIVLGHLTYVLNLKVPPHKAIPISKAFLEVLGKEWGSRIEMPTHEVIEKLEETGWMKRLEDEGVKEKDIADAIYESLA